MYCQVLKFSLRNNSPPEKLSADTFGTKYHYRKNSSHDSVKIKTLITWNKSFVLPPEHFQCSQSNGEHIELYLQNNKITKQLNDNWSKSIAWKKHIAIVKSNI